MYDTFLTAVNLSFSLRTQALRIGIPLFETRLFFVQPLVPHQLPCYDFAPTVFF